MSDVYWKLKIRHGMSTTVTVVCLQDFDEVDYNQHDFVRDPETNEQYRFDDEADAIAMLNKVVKPHLVDSNYRQFDQSTLFKDRS